MSSADSGALDSAWFEDGPHADVSLLGLSGSLCPEDSTLFSVLPESFALHFTGEQSGAQDCEIRLRMVVPAGYRFRRPIISGSGWASRVDDSVPPTRITMTYGMLDTRLTSQHFVWGTPFDDVLSDVFMVVDTPHLVVPECEDPAQPIELELTLSIKMDTPEGGVVSLQGIDATLEHGVEWTTCEHGFPER